jgi:hypothetical protein
MEFTSVLAAILRGLPLFAASHLRMTLEDDAPKSVGDELG